ncbi:MAG: hypothetical protein ACYTXE_44070, partial [Nostoc sp.]
GTCRASVHQSLEYLSSMVGYFEMLSFFLLNLPLLFRSLKNAEHFQETNSSLAKVQQGYV